MVQSINTKVDLVIDATAFTGLTDYGKIMIGDARIRILSTEETFGILFKSLGKRLITSSHPLCSKANGFRAMPFKQRKMVHIHFLLKNPKKYFALSENT